MRFRSYGSRIPFAVALALGLAAPGYGQNAAPSQGGGQATQLNEIIVTAQRLEQRLLDVPIAMTVYDQRQLAHLNIVSADDLATYNPSLSIDNQFGSNFTTFSIRGFSQALSTAPTVAVYFDDAVSPTGDGQGAEGNGAGPGEFFDLQNVQVLEGPQGTLFGLNTTGGAVLLVPRKPTSKFGGYVEATFGDYGLKREQAVLNLPVSAALRIRLGVDHESRSGYLRNTSGIGPLDYNNIDYTAARLSAVLDITPNLETYVVGSYALSMNNGPLPQLFACNPKVALGSFACAQLAKQPAGDTYAVQNGTSGPMSYLRTFQVIDTTTWQATDALTVKNIFNYGQLRSAETFNDFGTRFLIPAGIPGIGGLPFTFTDQHSPQAGAGTDQYTFSDELQFHGTALANRLMWQGGGYIERSAPIGGLLGPVSANDIYCSNIYALQCTDVLGILSGHEGRVGGVGSSAAQIESNDLAVYGQATYSLTSRWKLTGGMRYTTDWKDANFNRFTYSFFQPNVPTEACGSILTSLAVNCVQSAHQKSSAPTWLVDLQYYPRRNTMIYAKYARGYRAGGVDPTAPDGYKTFGPEHLDDFELGEKSSFDSPVPVSLDANVFYNRFTDQQLLVGFIGGLGVSPTSGIANAGVARIYGAEIDASITPFRRFTFSAAYDYLHTQLVTLTPVHLTPGGLYTIVEFPTTVGSQLPHAPKDKLSANVSYALPLPQNMGDMEVGANYTYTSATQIAAAFETPYGTLPSYGLLNMHLDWNDIGSSPVDVELFVTNLTNKFYWNNTSQLYNFLGFESRWLGEPRMFGVRVRVRFGRQ